MPTAVDGASFAYLGFRRVTADRMTCEFGAYGHGPEAKALVARFVASIQSWDRGNLGARFEVYPAGTPDDQLPQRALVLEKKHTRVAITWS
jgi:protein-L-isoaspartate(D-aspartate) O-methyltransferase